LTQSYVVGAISGTATIVAAVVAFVMLVSMQTLQEWPISGLDPGLGGGDSGGATRAPESRTPAPNQTSAVAPSASLGAAQAPTVAAGTERHGHAGIGGGSAITGSGDGSGDIATGAPTAFSPSRGSEPPSDAGSAAPVESTSPGSGSAGSGSGSGSEGGDGAESGPVSRSAPGVDEAPPEEGEETTPPPADCDDADSESDNAASDAADSDNVAPDEAVCDEAPDEAVCDEAASEEGAGEQHDSDSHGAPADPSSAFWTQRG
jgi:hypothetical protein